MASKPIKKVLVILSLLIGAGLIGLAAFWLTDRFVTQESASINSFTECVAAGYPVTESHPRQCSTPGGKNFVEEVDTQDGGEDVAATDMVEYVSSEGEVIRIISPQSGEEVSSPLNISGETRGSWSFEADFPIELLDWQDNVVTEGVATLTGDWMTTDYVPFEATLEFDSSELSGQGILVLRKDNPSGLEENEDYLEIPIIFE
ncbi:MAG: Gmad2 immunoglobulin-like domain-containing protein [Candidatus Saccharimonadales bacterium]